MNEFRLHNLPDYGKLFVGLFTALMLLVCLWAAWLYTVDKGGVDEANLPAYLQEEQVDTTLPHHRDTVSAAFDTLPILAPVWDSSLQGQGLVLDSISAESLRVVMNRPETVYVAADDDESQFRENLGLAHTHINGQTLLFFAFGLIFIFTSVSPARKKLVLWIFAGAVVLHNVGLTGEGYGWVWDDLLAVSGVVILVTIAFMALTIFADLLKSPETAKRV